MQITTNRVALAAAMVLLAACGSGGGSRADASADASADAPSGAAADGAMGTDIDAATNAGIDGLGAPNDLPAAGEGGQEANPVEARTDSPVLAMDSAPDIGGIDVPALDAGSEASPSDLSADRSTPDAPSVDAADVPAGADGPAAIDAAPVAVSQRGSAGTPAVDRPSARYGHAAAFDPNRGKLVLFGGESAEFYCPTSGLCADTWEWDGASGAWQNRTPATGPQPTGRSQHAMVYDPVRQRVLLFGGFDGAFRQDAWTWDGTAWSDVTPAGPKPSPRQNVGLVWDAARGRALLFGGGETDGANPKADTWEWDGGAWTERTTAPSPPARQGHAMAYDPASQDVLMFGGSSGFGYLDDTWTWNGATGVWAALSIAGASPSSRFYPRMDHDGRRGHILLYGGMTTGITAPEVWQWNGAGSGWSNLGGTAPMPSRCYHTMTFDSIRGKLVVFGGVNIEVANGPSLYQDDSSGNVGEPSGVRPASLPP